MKPKLNTFIFILHIFWITRRLWQTLQTGRASSRGQRSLYRHSVRVHCTGLTVADDNLFLQWACHKSFSVAIFPPENKFNQPKRTLPFKNSWCSSFGAVLHFSNSLQRTKIQRLSVHFVGALSNYNYKSTELCAQKKYFLYQYQMNNALIQLRLDQKAYSGFKYIYI